MYLCIGYYLIEKIRVLIVYLYSLDIVFKFFFLFLERGYLGRKFIYMFVGFREFVFCCFFCFFSLFKGCFEFFNFILKYYVVVFSYIIRFMGFFFLVLFFFDLSLYFLFKKFYILFFYVFVYKKNVDF